MSAVRQFVEKTVPQGVDELVAYQVDTTPWGGTPGGVSVVIKDKDGTDTSATNLQGAASVVGNVITLPLVKSLTIALSPYRLEVKWTYNGNTFEAYGFIQAET